MTGTHWTERFLAADERILWQGSPAFRFSLAPLDGLTLCGPFIITLMIFCAIQMPVTQYAPAVVAAVWGVVMTISIALLWLLLSALIYRPWLLRHTAYVVTDRRILRRRGRSVDGLTFLAMPEPRLERHPDGLHTILFYSGQPPIPPEFQQQATENSPLQFRLDHLADAQALLAMLRRQRDAARPHPLPQVLQTPLLPVERDERVLWQGQAHFRISDVLPLRYLIIGAMLTILPLLCRFLMRHHPHGIPEALRLMAEFYLQIGTFLLFERSIRMVWRIRHSAFVVTDQRVLMRWGRKTQDIRLAAVPGVFLAQDDGQLGTVIVSLRGRQSAQTLMLRGLPDAARVQLLITSAIRDPSLFRRNDP